MRIIKYQIKKVEGNEKRYMIGIVEDIKERREIEKRMVNIEMNERMKGMKNREYLKKNVGRMLKKGRD